MFDRFRRFVTFSVATYLRDAGVAEEYVTAAVSSPEFDAWVRELWGMTQST